MEVRVQVTARFQKDIGHLRESERAAVLRQMVALRDFSAASPSGLPGDAFRPYDLKLAGDLDPTLYVVRVGPDLRLMVTIDDDPLFEARLLTFLRVVHTRDVHRSYRSVAESLYHGLLVSRQGSEEGDDGDS